MAVTFTDLNPRFCAYAHSRGMTGTELQSIGFAPHEFMEFIRRELFSYCDAIGRKTYRLGDKADHAAFTAYLLDKHKEPSNV